MKEKIRKTERKKGKKGQEKDKRKKLHHKEKSKEEGGRGVGVREGREDRAVWRAVRLEVLAYLGNAQ